MFCKLFVLAVVLVAFVCAEPEPGYAAAGLGYSGLGYGARTIGFGGYGARSFGYGGYGGYGAAYGRLGYGRTYYG